MGIINGQWVYIVGYDQSATKSGAWTAAFLKNGLLKATADESDLGMIFCNSLAKYKMSHQNPKDWPQCWATGSSDFKEPKCDGSYTVGSVLLGK